MKTLKILDWPEKRFYGDSHPFHRWKNEFLAHGLKVEFYTNHLDKRLADADYLLLHSRYFAGGWQHLQTRNTQNETELMAYLQKMNTQTGRLIWFDAADSSGSSDFPIIPYVDVFLKKQVLKDKQYYTDANQGRNLRLWLDLLPKNAKTVFEPCPVNQLEKIKTGWNIGFNDYRYFGYKMSRLSNYLSYKVYPPRFSAVVKKRNLDLTFRGTIHQDQGQVKGISDQRNYILALFTQLQLQIASGRNVSKSRYWKELRNSKIGLSPFGWGEICYRDFEIFISGALLVKPLMNHLETFPNLYQENETYIPVSWDLLDLEEKLDHLITYYKSHQDVAAYGQEVYRKAIYDAESFVRQIEQGIGKI
jgi:hypothetical protein